MSFDGETPATPDAAKLAWAVKAVLRDLRPWPGCRVTVEARDLDESVRVVIEPAVESMVLATAPTEARR